MLRNLIVSEPAEFEDRSDEEYTIDLDTGSTVTHVWCEIVRRGPFVRSDAMESTDELADMEVFRGFRQGTNYQVTEAETRKILELMETPAP